MTMSDVKKLIDIKSFLIGAVFVTVMAGVGAWFFALPFWHVVLIALACTAILGLIAIFENGSK